MAAAQLTEIGSSISTPKTNATVVLTSMEIYVDLTGIIDVDAEIRRLEKEKANVEKQITGKQHKLANENFVAKAKQEVVERERDGLVKLKTQLETINDALMTNESDRKVL